MSKTLFLKGFSFCEFPLETPVEDMFSSDLFYPVDIPHDYMIYHTEDLYKDSIGCYKKIFNLKSKTGHTYLLRFEGVYMDSRIYLNGKQIFEWKYGYSTFDVDLTPYLKNGENTLFVTCTYRSPNSRWYSGAGIYRNVWLIDKDFAYLPMDGIYVSTKKDDDEFLVQIDTEGVALNSTSAVIRHSLFDKDNTLVASCEKEISLSENVTVNTQFMHIKDPVCWDIENPYVYSLKTELLAEGKVIDSDLNPLGFRTISFDPDKGFFLNGRNVKINGVCEHHDLGALGSAMNKKALKRQFEKLIKMGVNSIRTSHNMPAVEVMELADEMGLLIFSESFDMWELPKTTYDYGNYFPEWFETDIRSWVRRDRNHPSLFIWSIGNEIYDTHAGSGYEWTLALRDAVKKYDYHHNAYIGIGSNYIEWDNAQKCSNELELSGYNYGERLYDEHHNKYPHWCIFGSETASTVQSRGIYHFPYETRILTYEDGQCSCLGNCSTNWGAKSAAWVIAEHRDRDFVFGQYLWTGWDYIGEPTPFHSKNSFFGQIDTAGFEKDTYYQYQAEWTDYKKSPMVHLLPYWDFNEGQIIDVCAYSNAPYVELYLNGISLGKQFIDHQNGSELQGHWKVPYQKGALLVKAMDEDGNVVAEDMQKTFGDPAKINISASDMTLLANGEDLSFIEITLLDKNNTPVANAKNRVTVSVSGAGRLVGLDNGDSTDYEEYKCTSRRLFSGKLLAIVASKAEPGDIEVKVSSKDLPDSLIHIQSIAFKGEKASFIDECKECKHPDDVPVRKIELVNLSASKLTPDAPTARVSFKIYPENATYREITFRALTKDAVDANYASVEVNGSEAIVMATGDGSFTLTAFANNDKDHPEVISSLDFEASGLGVAAHDAYSMVPGIQFSKAHDPEAKLSFLGGVFIPNPKDGTAFVTYENVDLGSFGSDEIHVPIFTFHDELPIKIFLGDESGECLFDGIYRAKSIYNTYQENVFKLSRRLKGVVTLTFSFVEDTRFSLQGFYFTKPDKAYEKLSPLDNLRITGDSFTLEDDAVTGIGNNVTIEFDGMDFHDGLSGIKILSRSRNKNTSMHILFANGAKTVRQMVEIPGSRDYAEVTLPLEDVNISGNVSLLFLPGTDFDLKSFQFIGK